MINLKILTYIYYVYAGLLVLGSIALITEGTFDIYAFMSLVATGIAVYLIAKK